MSWFLKYTFAATHPDGDRDLTPDIADLITADEQSDEGNFVRRVVSNPFTLTGEDYQWLQAIDNGPNRCEKIGITITSICGGVTYTHFEGTISPNKVEFIPNQCKCIFNLDPQDEYTCLLENWEIEQNVLNGTEKRTAYVLVGELEAITCSDTTYTGGFPSVSPPWTEITTCISPGEGWTLVRVFYFVQGVGTDVVRSTYVREKVTGSVSQPFGSGWIDLGGGDWARPVQLSDTFTTVTNIPGSGTIQFEAFYQVIGADIVRDPSGDVTDDGYALLSGGAPGGFLYWRKVSYDNGIRLEELFDKFMGAIACEGYTVKSEFFRINNTSTPATQVYTDILADWEQVMVWEITDMVNPQAFSNATREMLTLKQAIEGLKAIWNVDWRIEDSTTIRIEHISFFEQEQGVDLLATYPSYIEKADAYKYANAELPSQETFQWPYEASEEFAGEPIIYQGACAGEEERSFAPQVFYSDLPYLVGNPDKIGTDGFFIAGVFVDGATFYIQQGDNGYNSGLAYPHLHEKYWKHKRPATPGIMNGVSTDFLSTDRLKEQETLSVAMPLPDYDAFDAAQLHNTQYGYGEVVTEYSHKTQQLTLNLRHDS